MVPETSIGAATVLSFQIFGCQRSRLWVPRLESPDLYHRSAGPGYMSAEAEAGDAVAWVVDFAGVQLKLA
jgi:hypothetical protein